MAMIIRPTYQLLFKWNYWT